MLRRIPGSAVVILLATSRIHARCTYLAPNVRASALKMCGDAPKPGIGTPASRRRRQCVVYMHTAINVTLTLQLWLWFYVQIHIL
jgi:hypothetical protein